MYISYNILQYALFLGVRFVVEEGNLDLEWVYENFSLAVKAFWQIRMTHRDIQK